MSSVFSAPGAEPQSCRRVVEQRAHRVARTTRETAALIARDHTSLELGLLPTPALCGDAFSAVARYEPGRTHALLGGDFYDVVQTDDASVHVLLGDVSGHGAAEAALAVHLRVAWRTAVLCGVGQLEQPALLERILVGERADDDTYATLVSLVFRPDGTSVNVVSAGHPGLLLRQPEGIRWVEPRAGIALGLFPGHGDWTETELPLSPRDSVVLFTDGLFEGRTDRTARLGEEGLLRLAHHHARLPAREFVDALVSDAASLAAPFGGLEDDVAVLHLCWNPGESPRGRTT